MTVSTHTGFLFLVLVAALVGCDTARAPTAPPPQQAVPPPDGNGYTLIAVTLFGVISETTPTGQAPIADVTVYCDACGEFGHTWARTDANGYYSFSGNLDAGGGIWLSADPTSLRVSKEGYQDPAGLPPPSARLPSGPGWREVPINGDTRFDIQLARR